MANLLAAIEVSPAQAALNSFLTSPGIYVAQYGATLSSSVMGHFVTAGSPPSNWFFIGPGSRPTVVQLSGTQFLIMFEYLSHLTLRALNISTWPPNQVVPVTTSPFSIEFPNDALALRIRGGVTNSYGQIKTELNPPFLKNTLVYFDPIADDYYTELTLNPSYVSGVPAGVTPYFRLYRSPLGPPVWTLIQDWTTNLDVIDTNPGPFQFQYSATVGENFSPSVPNDPTQHLESALGKVKVANSTIPPFAFEVIHADTLTLKLSDVNSYGSFDPKQHFFVQAVADAVRSVKQSGTAPLLIFDPGTSSYSNMGAREKFVVFYVSFTPDTSPSDEIKFGQQATTVPLYGGNAFGYFGARI